MKRLLAIALLLLLIGCTSAQLPRQAQQSSVPSTPAEVSEPVPQPPKLSPSGNVPLVEQKRLVADLQALAGERYTQAARDRARTYLLKTLRKDGWNGTTQVFSGGVNLIAKRPESSPKTETVVLRSDHAPFWAKNIGAVMVTDTANYRNPHYHQPSDAPDTLDLDFLTQATQLVVNATTVLLDSSH